MQGNRFAVFACLMCCSGTLESGSPMDSAEDTADIVETEEVNQEDPFDTDLLETESVQESEVNQEDTDTDDDTEEEDSGKEKSLRVLVEQQQAVGHVLKKQENRLDEVNEMLEAMLLMLKLEGGGHPAKFIAEESKPPQIPIQSAPKEEER